MTSGSLRSNACNVSAIERSTWGHDSVVEVDATQPLQTDRLAERLEARGGATEHGGVERATAEVVHGDDLADGHPRKVGCVVDGRGDRLGDQRDVAETARLGGLAQQVDP